MTTDRFDNNDSAMEGESHLSASFSTIYWLKSLIILIMLIGYLFAGAAVFNALEKPSSRRAAKQFENFLFKLANENDCVDNDTVNDLMDIVTRSISEGSYNLGHPYAATLDLKNDSYLEEQWSLYKSFTFSFTVVTTIGYGNLAPRTMLGEIFCVLYAVFGIPVMAALLFTVGEILQFLSSRLFQVIKKHFSCLIPSNPRVKTLFLIVKCLVVAYVMIVSLPSAIVYSQGWSFIAGHYFSVISLSTIGLGDLVPEEDSGMHAPLKVVILCLVYMYVIICLGMISMVLNTLIGKQARVASNISRTVEHSAFWMRLQHQFQRNDEIDEHGGEEINEQGGDEINKHGGEEINEHSGEEINEHSGSMRRRSVSDLWSRIRRGVDYNENTSEALRRISRRFEEGRMQPDREGNKDNKTIPELSVGE